jgi:hypothetical protein
LTARQLVHKPPHTRLSFAVISDPATTQSRTIEILEARPCRCDNIVISIKVINSSSRQCRCSSIHIVNLAKDSEFPGGPFSLTQSLCLHDSLRGNFLTPGLIRSKCCYHHLIIYRSFGPRQKACYRSFPLTSVEAMIANTTCSICGSLRLRSLPFVNYCFGYYT